MLASPLACSSVINVYVSNLYVDIMHFCKAALYLMSIDKSLAILSKA